MLFLEYFIDEAQRNVRYYILYTLLHAKRGMKLMFHRAFLSTFLRFFPFFIILIVNLHLQPAMAQEVEQDTSEDTAIPVSMPVIVDGETIFIVRGMSARPAEERASMISDNLIKVAEESDDNKVSIRIRTSEHGEEILANGSKIHIVTQADAEFEQVEIDVLIYLLADSIEAAILNYRLDRSYDARVDSLIEALLWTLGFVGFSFLYFRQRNSFPVLIGKHIERRFVGVEEATQEIVQGKAVAALSQFILRFLLLALYCILIYYYISFVLFAFAETRPFAEILITYITDPVFEALMGVVHYIPNLVTLAIIFYFTRYAIRATKVFFTNIEAGTFKLKDFEPHWVWPSYNIVRALLIAIGVVFAFPYIPGSDSAAFQGLTILAGVMVSMGSNSVVSNVLAGLFVLYRRSANVGDRIKIGEHVGDVVRIQLTETHLKSVKNELISIPNAQLLNSDVINYSSKIDGRGLLLHTTVGIGYEEPQEKVEAMLLEAANRTQGLKKSPPPFVLWTALADYAINYQVNAYTTRGSSMPKMLSDLHRNIVAVFNENNVQIMTPSYEADTPEPKIPTEAWDGKLAKGIES